MAESDFSTFAVNPNPPLRPFAVASWLGMSPEDILAGLADGSIAPPPGAAPDWRPPGLADISDGASAFNSAPPTTGSAGIPTTGPITPPDPTTAANDVGATPDRARVQGWFQALDSTLTSSAFDAIWNRAGENDATRAASLTGYLARTLLGTASAQVDGATTAGAAGNGGISASLSAFTADPSHKAHIVDLAGMDGATLAALARTDIGYRYAMAQLDSVALTGNRSLFAAANTDSILDRFDPDTGETQLSDAWLGDRAKFLAWKMAGDAGYDLTIGGNQSWTFIDLAKTGADGKPLSLNLTPVDGDDIRNQVIFGADNADNIKGKSGTDRIYGGVGDDVLRGAGGADHLEGGHGDDTVMGGSGNDELAGNQGDDDLDGGRGSDALDGGSGDDTLTGGRGDDVLAGGEGADSYVIDAGDGSDTITDTDGQGSILLDDVAINGGTRSQSRSWTSADGRLDYSLEGSLTGEGTLTIRAFAAGSDHAGNPDNVIRVNDWHNGDLGITLSTDASASASDSASAADIPGPGSQANSDASPADTLAAPAADSAMASAVAGEAPVADAPQTGATPSAPVEVHDPLAQFFGASPQSGQAVDPVSMQNAVAAFIGVPVSPDISLAAPFGSSSIANAVSVADVTGALAGDVAADDLGHESASGMVQLTPDWHLIEPAHLPSDGSPRATGIAALAARR